MTVHYNMMSVPHHDVWINQLSSQESCPDRPQIVDPARLHELLTDPLPHQYDRVLIVDARAAYEFENQGHITGALNIVSSAELEDLYSSYQDYGAQVCVVFYCEHSKKEGPMLMQAFHKHDLMLSKNTESSVAFPNIFLLKGGYHSFRALAGGMCVSGRLNHNMKNRVARNHVRRSKSLYDATPTAQTGSE